MASTRALLVVAVALAAALGAAHGASYTVGAPAGSWDLRTNYTRWASGVTFRAGDQLVFKYASGAHDVVEVSKAGYDACSAASPLATFATGDDTVPLHAGGGGVTRYFICGVPGHCAGGMKLAVRVQPALCRRTRRRRRSSCTPASSSAAASARVDGSLAGIVLAAVVASLMAFC